MSTIDTYLPGSHTAVDDAAAWLERHTAVHVAGSTHTSTARHLSQRIWSGSASDAYRDFARDLINAHEELEDRARSAADRFRSYAQQLKWRQEDMERHRSEAVDGGLTVRDTVIHEPYSLTRPTWPGLGATRQQLDQYNRALERYEAAKSRMDLFIHLSGRVQGTFERLDDWVVDYLVPEEEKVNTPTLAGPMAAAARSLPDVAISSAEVQYSRKADEVLAAAQQRALQDARARSGNPAVRSGRKPPREEAVARRLARSSAPGKARGLAKLAKGLGIAGVVVSVAVGAADIAAGASPSSIALETVAGIAAGAAVMAGAAALTVSAPVVVVGAVAVGVAVGASYAASWAYENFVPQATREWIDEGIRDVGAAIGGFFRGLFS